MRSDEVFYKENESIVEIIEENGDLTETTTLTEINGGKTSCSQIVRRAKD